MVFNLSEGQCLSVWDGDANACCIHLSWEYLRRCQEMCFLAFSTSMKIYFWDVNQCPFPSFKYIVIYIYICYIFFNPCFHISLFYFFFFFALYFFTYTFSPFIICLVSSHLLCIMTRKSFTTWNIWVFTSFSYRKTKNGQRTKKKKKKVVWLFLKFVFLMRLDIFLVWEVVEIEYQIRR